MSDVFISYSRQNSNFARHLVEALQAAGRDSWIDWEDIPRTAQWWQEIQEGIDSADTFVSILTPESLGSSACTLEIAYAFANSKRIIPILHIKADAAAAFGRIAAAPIDDVLEKMLDGRDLLLLARENWQRLSEINWVFFCEEDDFDAALKQLLEALEIDLAHVKMHTRLLTRAKEWERTPDDASLLLSGDSLRAAENWFEFNADKNPPPTDLHRRYIEASKAKREQDADADHKRQARERKLLQEAAENARRAEAAEKARAIRFRNAARFAGGLLVIAIILLVVAGVTTVNTNTALATAQFGSTLSAFEGQRLSTLIPGLGQIPPTLTTTLMPQEAFATATQIAIAYGHDDDVIQSFNGVDMVQVPAGCFFMGAIFNNETRPIHEICFDAPFWIDRFEVTNKQFEDFHGQAEEPSWWTGDNRPRDRVNWFEARDFCAKRGARLPTEAEWEYAARGPDSRTYPWGNDWNTDNLVWFDNAGTNDETADVGSIPAGASWIGALDMAGNVFEWTSSLYLPYPYHESDGREDPNNSTDVRVLRGGSSEYNTTDFFRASYRFYDLPVHGIVPSGFRCARSA